MALGPLLVLVMVSQYLLHLKKSGFIYQWRVITLDRDIACLEPGLPYIAAMVKHTAPRLFANAVTPAASPAKRESMIRPPFKCPLAGGKFPKGFSNKWTLLRVYLNP